MLSLFLKLCGLLHAEIYIEVPTNGYQEYVKNKLNTKDLMNSRHISITTNYAN